ncbi:hypothetical protein GCM10010129_41310 [Streptomyces fumigatiscleroticus]|nr:hypothetical protein GCM10010129_41310 [Streptomyces fumigatiscleroticus]
MVSSWDASSGPVARALPERALHTFSGGDRDPHVLCPIRPLATPNLELMHVPTDSRRRRCRVAGWAVALSLTAALMPQPGYAAPSDPGPQDKKSLTEVRAELDDLYRDAEVATEAFNTADEKAKKQQERLATLRTDLARTEDRVNRLHDLAGAAARIQYRGGHLAATGIQLLLGDHPDEALDEASQAHQALRSLLNVSEAQSAAEKKLRERTDAATEELGELKRSREDKAKAQQRIETKIAAAQRIESQLEDEQVRRLAELEKEKAEEARSAWTVDDSGTGTGTGSGSGGKPGAGVGTGGGKTTGGAAAKALDFALAQIGKPYVWGAVGPSSYDCSGLTSAAWAAAGHPIPRTSQAQWQGLTHVSLSSVQPGDLIIYYSDATHVGMYAGDGQIVHAPRPGRTVTLAPAASMPILGVVRPGA